MITLELAKTKLNELNVLIRYLSFLQNNGFSDLGKGKILGQVQLLKELISEGGERSEYNEEISQETSSTSTNEDEQLQYRYSYSYRRRSGKISKSVRSAIQQYVVV